MKNRTSKKPTENVNCNTETSDMGGKGVTVLNDPRNRVSSSFDAKTVPTSDPEVRAELRKLGEPVTYFGEDDSDRRQRLIKLLSEKKHTNFDFDYEMEEDELLENEESDENEDDEDFYTPGEQELYTAREEILHSSLERARKRIEKQQKKTKDQSFIKYLKHRRHINSQLAKYELFGTQLIQGNTRALSAVRFSKDSELIATGSWDGGIYILDSGDLSTKFKSASGYHSEKVSAIDWDVYTDSNLLVSGGNEGNINFWKVNKESETKVIKPVVSIKAAHDNRITKTLFHPSGRFVTSTSCDQTWKLWDVNRPENALLQQEGHSKEVFAGSFHPDGSLFASGGFDAIGRIWDMRSGRSIVTLERHIKGIYSMDWSPNGYHLATASGDCSVKIWDLRKLQRDFKEIFSIPVHTKLVSDVRFFNRRSVSNVLSTEVANENGDNPEVLDSDGSFLVTSSFDGLVNIWSADNFIKVKTLRGHNDKVMSCDISCDGSTIVSSGWDRTVKLWKS
ncbi:hypothetical protein G9P44_002001 [Scheffersomyces stipitis]|nr:hypothetical protein G9P44_002001 [Scheffersomyces stipitis]